MSGEIKFSKLRLPISKRNKSATTSQISSFFVKPSDKTQGDAHCSTTVSAAPSPPVGALKSSEPPAIQITSSLPEPSPANDSVQSDSKHSFSCFEATKPSKLRRIVSSQIGNRSTIKEFFLSQSIDKDFESPPQKLVKKASTFKKTKKQPNNSKKQPKISNSFLKREQILADYIAEQSLRDDVDPNELQMALALSRSEAKQCTVGIGGDAEASSHGSCNSMEALCEKLQEFEHRRHRKVGKSQTYGASKGRAKWANKFSSLTLRNPEQQHEKISRKVEELLNCQNIRIEASVNNSNAGLTIASNLLSNLNRTDNATYFRHSDYELNSVDEFYVTSIFQPAKSKIGSLLKDFRAIPGRDKSPIKIPLSKNDDLCNKLSQKDSESNPSPNINEDSGSRLLEKPTLPSTSFDNNSEDQNFFRESSPDLFMDEEDEPFSSEQSVENTIKLSEEKEVKNSFMMSEKRNINYSLDTHSKDGGFMEIVTISSESISNEIVTVENFSIEEEKIVNTSGIWNQDLNYTLRNVHDESEPKEAEHVIDLTQENIVDLTQPDFECENDSITNDKDDFLYVSQKSMHSNNLGNLSEDSTSSVIVLSDDEVNYSIKVAKGLNTRNDGDCEDSDDELMSSFGKSDAGTSLENHRCSYNKFSDNCTLKHYESPLKLSDVGAADEYVCEMNISNRIKENELNCSLAHEIMSHSFEEEFERISGDIENSDTLNPTNPTDGVMCLDLTQTTPPNFQDIDTSGCSNNFNKSISSSSKKFKKTHSDSFLVPKNKHGMLKRHSSSKQFEELNIGEFESNGVDDGLDEFDRLVYGNLQDKNGKSHERSKLPANNNKQSVNDSIEEITLDGNVYLVKMQNVASRPDYERMDSPIRLKELHKLGLKPLKRKQAIIMLEYVYNQTHPFVIDEDNAGNDASEPENDDVIYDNNLNLSGGDCDQRIPRANANQGISNKYDLKDCRGSLLLDDDGLVPEIDAEEYIFQTNSRAKVSTARLPLHIAWFNLIKSNRSLREAILYYEPIDLQEIFAFFKSIGYRFDPKDLKRFFDGRSIIFQYDLNKEGSNRHVRESQKSKRKAK